MHRCVDFCLPAQQQENGSYKINTSRIHVWKSGYTMTSSIFVLKGNPFWPSLENPLISIPSEANLIQKGIIKHHRGFLKIEVRSFRIIMVYKLYITTVSCSREVCWCLFTFFDRLTATPTNKEVLVFTRWRCVVILCNGVAIFYFLDAYFWQMCFIQFGGNPKKIFLVYLTKPYK